MCIFPFAALSSKEVDTKVYIPTLYWFVGGGLGAAFATEQNVPKQVLPF